MSSPAVRLPPIMSSDRDFATSVEHDPANRPFVTPWDRTRHEGAIRCESVHTDGDCDALVVMSMLEQDHVAGFA